MKPFRFKKFDIRQSESVFRVGTDGVLLGALCDVSVAQNILEVGTGTGLVAMMMAQRNFNSKILSIDINEDAVEISAANFLNSPFNEQLQAELVDFKEMPENQRFDLIVSNPPFFEINSSSKDILARQTVALNFEELIRKSSRLLAENGIFSVIIPQSSFFVFKDLSLKHHLKLQRKVSIFGTENSLAKRVLLEFGFKEKIVKEEQVIIENSPRKYSDQYLEITKDFHVFG